MVCVCVLACGWVGRWLGWGGWGGGTWSHLGLAVVCGWVGEWLSVGGWVNGCLLGWVGLGWGGGRGTWSHLGLAVRVLTDDTSCLRRERGGEGGR